MSTVSYGQNSDADTIKSLKLKLEKSTIIRQQIDISTQLGRIYLYRPNSFEKDMDSANYYFMKSFRLSDSINVSDLRNQTNYLLAETRFEQQKFGEAYDYYHKVINYYNKNHKLEDEAKTWLSMANRTRNEVPLDNVLYNQNINNYHSALAIYKSLGLKFQELDVLKDIADYHLNQGNLDEAEKELVFVLEAYKKLDYYDIQHTYNLLCVVNRLNGDFSKSIYNGLKAVEYMVKNEDTLYAHYFYGNVADAYRELGETQQSIIWYNKVLSDWESENGVRDEYLYRNLNYLCKELVLINKAQTGLDLAVKISNTFPPNSAFQKSALAGAKAAAFNKLKKFDLAEKEYVDAVKWIDNDKNSSYLIFVSEALLDLGDFYLNQKQYDKAKDYIKQSLSVPKGIAAKTNVKDANLMLFKIDSTQGNYLEAISHFQKYKQINDSIFNATKSKQIEELQIQYQTVKKENDIKSLKNENLIQNNQLTKTTILKNVIFAGLLLFLITSILLFRSHRLKQRTNRLLVSQKGEIALQNTSLHGLLKEKEWLLKEIHHRVKNNLQIVMSLLNTQSKYIKNPEAFSAIKNSQHRLFAISLIHQKLYKTENTTLIDMNSYIKDLVGYLKDSFDINSNIDFELEIEHVMLQETQSIPVGLILNEAITNSIKYAFPRGQNGLITVTMTRENNNYYMSIQDNGVGISENVSRDASSSLGMTLIKGLTQQLDGDFTIKKTDGTLIEVVFKNKVISDMYTQQI